MLNAFQQRDAQYAFDRAYRKGRRDTNVLSRLRGQDNGILRLDDVVAVVPIQGESYQGVEDIPVDRIIGTENRGDDYSRAFLPLKRSLSGRWMQLHQLLAHTEFDEPISVIEAGGSYFVRDGNHRVSVAQSLGRTFLNAIVTRYDTPISIPPDLDRNQLSLIRQKVRFHQRTGTFDVLDDSHFSVACPSTWKYLEREINEYNYSWFVRRFGRQPENRKEQVLTWYENLYRPALDFIRQNYLTYLFPGMRETDVFVEMLRLWNSHENPDDLWFGDVYRKFAIRQRRRQLLRAIPQTFLNSIRAVVESPEDEYRRFLEISRVHQLVPGFRPLPKRKGFYRFLHHELVHRFAPGLKSELGRAPHIQELTALWHERFYAPVAEHARRRESPAEQTAFYRRFSMAHLERVLEGSVDLVPALEEEWHAMEDRSPSEE
jgi:hypothetical protein